jgi:hypothetical protein
MKMYTLFAACAALFVIGCAASPDVRTSEDMVANADPYEIGTAGAFFTGFTGIGIKPGTFLINFAPRTNEVILIMKNQGNDTHIFLDRKSRDIIMDASVRYLEQFESRTLQEKGNRLAEYGKLKAFMLWGILTLNAEGTAEVSLGYEFNKEAPYFTLTIPDTPNDRFEAVDRPSPIKRSGYFQIFFTRSQLIEFVEYLVQENLESTLEEKNISRASTDPDVY